MALDYGREEEIYRAAIEEGFSPSAAAGLVSNAFAESSYNPEAFNSAGGGQGAYGLFQWRGDRLAGLKSMFGDAPSLRDQVRYVKHEMQNDVGNAGISFDEFNAISDPMDAGSIFRARFERPGEDPGGYSRVRQNVGRIYNAYSGDENVYTPKFNEADTPLLSYSQDAAERAKQYQDATIGLSEKQDKDMRIALTGLIPGKYNQALAMLNKASQPQQPQPQPQQSLGANPIAASSKGLSMGTPNVGGAVQPTEAIPQPKRGLLDKLFPASGKEEGKPWYGRDSFRDMMAGVGVGLSQMSHGQPVNIIDTMSNLRKGRADLAQQEWERSRLERNDAAQQAKWAMDARQAAISNAREEEKLGMDRAKHGLELMKFDQSVRAGQPMSDSILDTAASINPELVSAYRDAAGSGMDMTSWNADIRKLLTDAVSQGPLPEDAAALKARYDNFEITPQEFVSGVTGLSPAGAKRLGVLVDTIGDLSPDERAFREEQVYNMRRAQALDEGVAAGSVAPPGGISGTGAPMTYSGYQLEQARQTAAAQEEARRVTASNVAMEEMQKEVDAKAAAFRNVDARIPNSNYLNTKQYNDGYNETSEVAGTISRMAQVASSLGFPSVKDGLKNYFKVDADLINQMDDDAAAYLFELMQAYDLGGVGFTDTEAARLLKATPNLAKTANGRARLLAGMSSSSAFNQARQNYMNKVGPVGENRVQFNKVSATMAADQAAITDALTFNNQRKLQGDRVDVNGNVVKPDGLNNPSRAATLYNAMNAYSSAKTPTEANEIANRYGVSYEEAKEALSSIVPTVSVYTAAYQPADTGINRIVAKDGIWHGKMLVRKLNPIDGSFVWVPQEASKEFDADPVAADRWSQMFREQVQ